MNPLLLQLLASRGGDTANPALAQMLAAMGQDSNGSGADALLDELGQDDPNLARVMKALAEARASRQQERPVIDVTPQLADETEREMARFRAQVDEAMAELNGLREKLDLLACALGACCLCWGQDNGCRICRGRGGPGFSRPDEAMFREYVLPAIRAFRGWDAGGRRTATAVPAPPQPRTDQKLEESNSHRKDIESHAAHRS
jgi:hypothetical protein